MAKDFRNKTFPKILRGYAPDEVDEYIARINTEYGRLERKLAETEKKLAAAVEKLDKADRKNGGEEEAGMRAAADAKETAAKIIGEAQKTADGIIKQAEKRAGEIEDEARKLSERVYSFRDMLFEAYNNHIEDIERVMGEVDALTGRGDDVRDDESGESDEDDENGEYDEDGESEDTSVEDSREPKTSFIGGDLYIDPDEYADDADDTADSSADAKEEERRRRLDRLFGIPEGNDGDVTSGSGLTNDSDSFGNRNRGINNDNDGIDAGESANDSDGDGDTRVLDLGELLRENHKASAEAEKASAPSASDGDGDSDGINASDSDEDGDFSVTPSGGEFSDFSSDEIDSILGKKVRALTDEFGVVYSDDRLPHEKNGKKGKGRR